MLKVLAIIPARSGSKNLTNKNIMDFNGIPLFVHSINHAKNSSYINRIIVSTDSPQYLQIAIKNGAEVPFIRPYEISGDNSLDLEVFIHALGFLKASEGYEPDLIVHLRPTHPIRDYRDIDTMINLLIINHDADSIRSVVRSNESPYKMWYVEDNLLIPVIKSNDELYNHPRQKLTETYYQNGSIDVIKLKTITKKQSMSGDIILSYIMDEKYDIDLLEEFKRYEKIFKLRSNLYRYVIDLDDILKIKNQKFDYLETEANHINIKLVNKLYDAGNTIILFFGSSNRDSIDWKSTIESQLNNWNIKYHELIIGKLDADFFVSERSIIIDELLKLVK